MGAFPIFTILKKVQMWAFIRWGSSLHQLYAKNIILSLGYCTENVLLHVLLLQQAPEETPLQCYKVASLLESMPECLGWCWSPITCLPGGWQENKDDVKWRTQLWGSERPGNASFCFHSVAVEINPPTPSPAPSRWQKSPWCSSSALQAHGQQSFFPNSSLDLSGSA